MITLSPELSVEKMRFRPYGDYGPGQFPSERTGPADEFGPVVVYLSSSTAPSGQATPANRRVRISQANEFFEPRVLAVRKGTTVEFPNDDEIFHNVFSLSAAASFDLGRYPRGESRSVRFEKPGVVSVFCNIHSDMSATVLVLDHPFFAKPDADGHFVIDGVPPGDHTVTLWHERMRPVELRAQVVAGETARLTVRLPVPKGTPDR